MKARGRALSVVAAAALSAAAGLFVSHRLADRASTVQVAPEAGTAVLSLRLPDVEGHATALSQWRDRVLVVNFWATWCPPCLAELPDFADTSRAFAGEPVQFVGVGIDRAENIRDFAAREKIPYPLLVAPPQTLDVTAALGNASRALPFTIIFDRRGNIAHIKLGTLNRAELEGKIRALLAR